MELLLISEIIINHHYDHCYYCHNYHFYLQLRKCLKLLLAEINIQLFTRFKILKTTVAAQKRI